MTQRYDRKSSRCSRTSNEELIRLHESSVPPSISDYVKEVDPLVERVILRCLSREPQARPSSVTQVAAALPGSDPLAAALAAGETPSPEMVAAAPREGALRPAVAVVCLLAFFVELAAVMWLSGLALHNLTPLEKSPEVLTDRARGVASKRGYVGAADTAYGINADPALFRADSHCDAGDHCHRPIRAADDHRLSSLLQPDVPLGADTELVELVRAEYVHHAGTGRGRGALQLLRIACRPAAVPQRPATRLNRTPVAAKKIEQAKKIGHICDLFASLNHEP